MAKSRIKTHHFIRHSVVITLILTAAVIVPVAYLASQARRDISVQYIDNATSLAVDEFQSMTGVIQTTLELVGDWGVSGLIDLSDTDAINNLFFPLIERETILYGISIADMDGTSYYLRRENKSLRTSITNATTSPGKSTIQLWDSAITANDCWISYCYSGKKC